MYAVYCYAANSTPQNVLEDLVKIVTGETDKANLSSNCVQINTSIVSTVPAGWSVYDDNASDAGLNAQVLRALNQDQASYKYCYFWLSDNLLHQATVETWNTSTHTAGTYTTGVTPNSVVYSEGGGYLYIYATEKNLYVLPWGANGYSVPTGCMELTRDTIPSTYPCAIAVGTGFLTGYGGVSIPRRKNSTTIGSMAQPLMAGPVFTPQSGIEYSSFLYRDENELTHLVASKICCTSMNDGSNVPVGHMYDVMCTGALAGDCLDEIAYNGLTYIFLKSGSNGILVVPKA